MRARPALRGLSPMHPRAREASDVVVDVVELELHQLRLQELGGGGCVSAVCSPT